MKYLAALALACALLLSSACTQSSQKLVEAGNRYHDKKKYKEASILYQKALTKDKTNAEAYYREGLNLLDSGEPVEASRFLRRAVDLQPTNMDATTKLAEIYLLAYSSRPQQFKTTLLPEIKELVAKVSKYQPDSFNGLRLQGLVALVESDPERALEAFSKANSLKPYSPDVVTWYAETLYNQQRVDEAVALERNMLAHDKKWGPGYDFLFLMYSRAAAKDKAAGDGAKAAAEQAQAKSVLEQRVQNDPHSAVALTNLANFDALSGNYDTGEAVIKRVLSDPNAFPNRREILGDFYFRTRKFDQAMQQYQAGQSEDPKKALLYKERIVNVYEATNRRDDALNLARTIAKDNPKDLSANEVYAAILLQNGSVDTITKSLGDLKELVKANPTDPLLHLDLAKAYFDTNDRDKSLSEAEEAQQGEIKQAQAEKRATRAQLLEQTRIIQGRIYEDKGQHAKAMEQANAILQTQPNNPDARLIKARAMVGIGQIDGAIPELEALAHQFPNMAAARFELADAYLAHRTPDKAAAEYQQLAKQYPNDLRSQVGLMNVQLAEGKPDQAITGMQALVNQQPKNAQLRYQFATLQAEAGVQVAAKDPARAKQLYQDAIANYKELTKTGTNSVDVSLRIGVLQRALGQYDAALASFEQATNADPHNSAALLNQAMLLEATGKTKEAMATYNKVLGIDPENPLAMNNVAFLNAQEGVNLDQAMTYAERAKQKLPNSPAISDTLGYVYYQKHLNTEALQIFRDLVASHRDNPTFLFHLALALEKNGDKGAARDEARKALQLSTEPDQQNRIKSFLNQLG